MGHPIVMGRKTYESIGRALPGRKNIVLTTRADFAAEGCVVVNSPAAALRAAEGAAEVMVIGGGEVYALFLPMAGRIYLTRVEADIDGDAFFPALADDDWLLVSDEPGRPEEKANYPDRFQLFDRRNA